MKVGLAIAAWLAACTSSPPAPTLVTDLHDASGLRVFDGTLYFRSAGFVWSIPADGSAQATQLYASAAECDGLRVNAAGVFFFGPKNADSTCDLMTGPSTGGAATVLAPALGPGRLELNDTVAVVMTKTATAVPIAGGPATVLGGTDPRYPLSGTAIDASNVYWKSVTNDEAHSPVMCGQQPLTGAPAIRWSCNGNGDLAAADNRFYATDHCIQGFECGSLYSDLIGGPGKLIAHSDSNPIGGVVLAGDHLYWIEYTRIVRSDLDGGAKTVIAELNAPSVDYSIRELAVDDAYVYWSTAYQTAIWRSPK